MPGNNTPNIVEVRPEVIFLSELLEELVTGKLRIPRFQRPFVWRRDQAISNWKSVGVGDGSRNIYAR